jgi:hypothetical protein
MIARLVELAAFLQRIAIVQIVPDAADQDEEFDAEALTRWRKHVARGCAAVLPDRLGRPARPGDGARTARRLRNDAAAHAGVSPDRPPRTLSRGRPPAARRVRQGSARAAPAAVRRGLTWLRRRPARHPAASSFPVGRRRYRPSRRSIDAANWPAVVEAAGLSGMVRQFALNCVPASFDQMTAGAEARSGGGDRRTRKSRISSCRLVDLSSAGRSACLRSGGCGAGDAGAAARARGTG